MKIPSDPEEKKRFLSMIINVCMASQQERRTLYEKRRRYFLYGQDADQKVKFNRLKSHMKLVSSFLYSAEGLIYNITAPNNTSEDDVDMYKSLQDDWNDDVHDSGLSDVIAEAVTWALNFDTMIVKIGWNDVTGQLFGKLVEPSSFGVYLEDESDFSNQPAMNHTYLMEYDEACERLVRAGRAAEIPSLIAEGSQQANSLPPAVNQLIISATSGENFAGNITGDVNPNYSPQPNFRADNSAPRVRFNETWVWDSDARDWRIFHSLEGAILLSDSLETIDALKKAQNLEKMKFDSTTNFFLKGENPFTPITPYSLYNYLWGDCHQEDIIPLQDWNTKRLEQIDETLERQDDPAKVLSGFQGLQDEKAEALGGPGTWISDAMPGAKVEELRPPMPPDLFREFNEIGGLMMEASGLTEVVSGRGSGGARGGQQQKQMQITGGGQIRKVAIGLEKPLVRIGELGIKLKMKNDDTKIRMSNGKDFVAAQAEGKFKIKVDGHSHSPLFTTETKELAAMLFKSQSIDQEWFIRMLNPPARDNLLHSLRRRQAAEAKARKEAAEAGAAQPHKKK